MVKIYREVYFDILWFHATPIVCGDAVLSHFNSDDSESAFFVRRRRKIFFGWFSFLVVDPKVGARTAGLGSGAIAGIVIAVILIVLITIDLFCCFFNSCGIIFCCHRAICGVDGGVKGEKDDCEYDS